MIGIPIKELKWSYDCYIFVLGINNKMVCILKWGKAYLIARLQSQHWFIQAGVWVREAASSFEESHKSKETSWNMYPAKWLVGKTSRWVNIWFVSCVFMLCL